MPSTFSTNLRLELQATGENQSTWGTLANQVFTDIDAAIAGRVTVVMASDANYTLTSNNGTPDEARYMGLNITSSTTLTATRDVIVPSVSKFYVVKNGTTGGQSINVRTSAGGTQAVVSNGSTSIIWCDGTTCSTTLMPDYAGLSASNVFNIGQTISASNATTLTTYLALSPTDFTTSKPGLFFTKTATATQWNILIYDGATTTGTINFEASSLAWGGVSLVTISGSQTLTNKTISGGTLSGTLAGTPTFSGMQTYSASNATTLTEYARYSPTDYGAGKPYLAIQKSATATTWNISIWDGSVNTGIINLSATDVRANNVPVVTTTGTQTVTNKSLEAGTTYIVGADPTKKLQFDTSSISTATTRTLTVPNASGTIALASGSSALIAPGTIVPFAGFTVPSGWLLCDGSAVSRTTYSTLLDAITITATASSNISSPILYDVTPDVESYNWTSDYTASITGANFSGVQTISSLGPSIVNISTNASVTGSFTIRIYPYGAGDGSTTFNVPDLRGYFVRGWDSTLSLYDPTARGLGTRQADAASFTYNTLSNTTVGGGTIRVTSISNSGGSSNVGQENRPKNLAVQYIIKV